MNKYKLHPWHGLHYGNSAPEKVTAFVEIVPNDSVKYEIDKESGWLKVDRPQLFSNRVPALYGFIPQTYCGEGIAQLASSHTKTLIHKGDGDPLDICILCENQITSGGIIVKAIPIGGFCLIDNGEADDKIIAVLENDAVYGNLKDIQSIPEKIIQRLKHYFLTYKNLPNEKNTIAISEIYGKKEAQHVIQQAIKDYNNEIRIS